MKRRKFIVLILENIETDFLHAIRPPFRGLSDVPPSKSSRFAKRHSSYNCVCVVSPIRTIVSSYATILLRLKSCYYHFVIPSQQINQGS